MSFFIFILRMNTIVCENSFAKCKKRVGGDDDKVGSDKMRIRTEFMTF